MYIFLLHCSSQFRPKATSFSLLKFCRVYFLRGYSKNKFTKGKKKLSSTKLLENDLLYGRSVCNIALKASRRAVFSLHLLNQWQDSEPEDRRVLEILEIAEERKIPLHFQKRTKLDSMVARRPHQGVCMEVGELPLSFMNEKFCEDSSVSTKESSRCVWVLLCDILDPMNLGAILRSCFYFNIQKVIITGHGCLVTPIVSKASSGASELLEMYWTDDPSSIIQALKKKDWDIIGTVAATPSGQKQEIEDISSFCQVKPTLVLFGNEGSGLPENMLKKCSRHISIQCSSESHRDGLRSLVGSLNVSAAAAIVLHSLRSGRAG